MAAGIAATLIVVAFIRRSAESPTPIDSATTTPADPVQTPIESTPGPVDSDRSEVVPPPVTATPESSTDTSNVATNRPPVAAPKPSSSPIINPRDEIAARLAQKLIRFEQPTPVEFETIRMQIEEMSGVTILYDETIADDSRFRIAEVQLALSGVTLAVVLDEAARQAGLNGVIDAEGVRLVPASERPMESREDAVDRP